MMCHKITHVFDQCVGLDLAVAYELALMIIKWQWTKIKKVDSLV